MYIRTCAHAMYHSRFRLRYALVRHSLSLSVKKGGATASPAPPPPPLDPPLLSGIECAQLISKCYDEATQWKANLQKIPNGKAGENFIKELSRLFRSYADGSSMDSIAFTAAFLFPILVLYTKSTFTTKVKGTDLPPQPSSEIVVKWSFSTLDGRGKNHSKLSHQPFFFRSHIIGINQLLNPLLI